MAQDPNSPASPPDDSTNSKSGGSSVRGNGPNPLYVVTGLVLLFLLVSMFQSSGGPSKEIGYSFFRDQVRSGAIEEVRFVEAMVYGKFKEEGPLPLDPDKVADFEKDLKDKAKAAAKSASSSAAVSTGEGKEPPFDPAKLSDKQKDALRLKSPEFYVRLPEYLAMDQGEPSLANDLEKNHVRVRAEGRTDIVNSLMPIITAAAFVVVALLIWGMLRRMRDQVSGGGILGNFNRSPARRYEADKDAVTFADVAGLDNVKAELEEIVEFLKSPEKFQKLGGRIPKGTLLMGPPGTGKTLLAKAVAGEAGVPFFAINGSEFIQMFVGVGASRVRDMFRTAKDSSPCIVFVDEIDAVGRVRGAGFGGGHDEREQTLNQILSEMDGFNPTDAVIVIAATNRPDVLDPALLRPGRFDRHITVDRPTLKGRIELLKVHTKKVPLAKDVDVERLAQGTVGMTGAAIRNLVNEAALWAARKNKSEVSQSDFEYARDKVLMGPRREEVLQGREKEMTAYHEAGHGLVAWLLPSANRVHKITIIPHGRALGVTQTVPDEDRMSLTSDQAYAILAYAMGGRSAEKLVFNEYNAGAASDLQRSTDIARRMVTQWGMSERLGPVYYSTSDENPFLGKEITEPRDYGDDTARIIDEEVARILHEAAQHATKLLEENRGKLDAVAQALIQKETLEEPDLEALIGPAARRRYATKDADALAAAVAGPGSVLVSSEPPPAADGGAPPAGGDKPSGDAPPA